MKKSEYIYVLRRTINEEIKYYMGTSINWTSEIGKAKTYANLAHIKSAYKYHGFIRTQMNGAKFEILRFRVDPEGVVVWTF